MAPAQFLERPKEPPRQWLPPLAGHPSKLSPDHLAADEYPAITRDASGRVWVAWSSCRPKTKEWPIENADIKAWLWPDDGANFKKQGPVESVWEALDRGYQYRFRRLGRQSLARYGRGLRHYRRLRG